MPIPTPTYSKFCRAVDDPHLLRIGLLRIARGINARINRKLHDPSRSVMDEDWDVLIILDACRYDSFLAQKHLLSADGSLQRRTSPGSDSWDFIQANYAGRRLHDTVYVSANPHIEKLDEGVFHSIEPLFAGESWNSELGTVEPERVAEAGIRAQERYPKKRLILHFMQPHYPFIGKRGQQISHRGYSRSIHDPNHDNAETRSVWKQLQRDPSGTDLDEVISAYHENLAVVMEVVDNLIAELRGKTVISSDHGNFLGERLWPLPFADFGHPANAFAPPLVHIPWYEITATDRPSIDSDPPVVSESSLDDSLLEDRLSALGYR